MHVQQSKRDKKDELKPFGRMLAKFAAANPSAVCHTIIMQVEAYPRHGEARTWWFVGGAARYLTPLGSGLLTFTIIQRLAGSGRDKLKVDGVNIANWLTALALFTAHAAKAHPDVDLTALCQYLTNQLCAGQGFDLLLLKELVFVMSAQGVITVLSADQLDGMAGGDALKSQTLAFGVVCDAKQLQHGMSRLLAALQQTRAMQRGDVLALLCLWKK